MEEVIAQGGDGQDAWEVCRFADGRKKFFSQVLVDHA